MKKLLSLTLLLAASTVLYAQPEQPKMYFGSFGHVNPKGIPKAIVTTRDKLLSNTKLTFQPGCELVSYTVSVLPKGGGIKGPMPSVTPAFPDRIKEKIISLGTDAIVYVENIKVLCYDEPREVSPFTVKYEQ